MAKSLRSKFKRKMRSLKRKKLAARQLKKLQAVVSNADATEVMEVVEENIPKPEQDEQMVVESSSGFNLKTMKKSDGTYPVWLSQRKIRKLKKKEKLKKKFNVRK